MNFRLMNDKENIKGVELMISMAQLSRATVAVMLAVFISSTAWGAEATLMEVRFQTPVWRELLRSKSGNDDAAVRVNGAMRIKASTNSWHTQYFPYQQGTKIIIKVRVKSVGLAKGENDRDVGRVTLRGFDGVKKLAQSYDVALVQGDSRWKTYKLTQILPESVHYFDVAVANAGKAGEAWFDNLRVSIIDSNTENLIGDPGFEGMLGADHWFYSNRKLDWDNLKSWAAGAVMDSDKEQPVAGKQAVKLMGTASLVSKPFTYRGEELFISGWLRTKNIKRGKKGWCQAGIQIVGLDAKGKALVHEDLKLQDGTTSWTYYQRKIQFGVAVKKVQVWVRIFEGATGTAWFDQVVFQRVPFKGEIVRFNAKAARIEIDVKNPGKQINDRVWSGIDLHHLGRLGRKEEQDALPLLKKIGMKMVRVRALGNYHLGVYNSDDPKTGEPIYKWDKLDELFDLLVRKYQFIPNVTLESTPPALARKGTPTTSGRNNNWPPKDMKKWGRYIEALLEHMVQRYGKEEVEKWYWEIWNEPPSKIYYLGTPEEFADIAEQDYLAAERVEKRHNMNLKMGLSSGGGWMNRYILERLKKINKLHLVEHYSEHYYLGERVPLRLMTEKIKEMNQLLKKYPQVGDYELGVTEWNCNSMRGTLPQMPWNATCVVKTIRLMLDAGLDYSTFFGYHSYPYQGAKTPTFNGFLSMIALNGVPKPVYNAFVFLNELRGGQRLKVKSSNDPIDGLAVLMPNGAIRIVLTNYDADTSRQPYRTRVTLKLAGAEGKGYHNTRHWAADNKYGNSYGKWVELGKPPVQDLKAKAAMLKAIQYGQLKPISVNERDWGISLRLTVPSPGIRFIELMPQGTKD